MGCSHREEQRDGRLLDILTDDEAGIRIVVSRLGAELVSLARRERNGRWTGFLHRDNDLSKPADGWANHATVMGYFLHRLKEGRSRYRGRLIEDGTHGFLRTKDWSLSEVATGEGRLTYRMTPEKFTEREYPLNVSLDLSYSLDSESLRVRFQFRNNEPALTAHVGFGLHPGFAARSFESFQLEMPAGHYRRRFSPTNYLSGETEEIDFGGGAMPFARSKLPGSYILELVDVPQRTFTYADQESRRTIALDLTDVPYVTLWSDGGPFLCVEPCWGLTDHDEQRAFEDKEGIQTIPAAGELSGGFSMAPRILE